MRPGILVPVPTLSACPHLNFRTVWFLVCVFAALLVSACGGSGGSTNPPVIEDPPESVDPPPMVDPPMLCGPFESDSSQTSSSRTIPYLPSASDVHGRQGVVRVINHSDEEGPVSIRVIDDQGNSFGPLTLSMCANQSIELNATDIENGNTEKGLEGAAGAGQGDWRLELSSKLDFNAFSRLEMSDGYLAPLQPTAPWVDGGHWIATFNPGSSQDQEGHLRLINLGESTASATISGIDDAGNASAGRLSVELLAGSATTWSAAELESDVESDPMGSLGDGEGRWQLAINSDRPLLAMSLLEAPTGLLANLSSALAYPEGGVHNLPFVPSTANARDRLGLVRVINRSNRSGEVSILAVDDAGLAYPELTLSLGAGETKHFDSNDLEQGNPSIGLSGSTGTGTGDWRLELSSSLQIEVLAYVKTTDGFLTAMHNSVPRTGNAYHLPAFWFGDHQGQSSSLRLVNAGQEAAQVMIEGIDQDGERSANKASLELSPGASRTIEAEELEAGGDGIDGSLGTGTGIWRLTVESEQPIAVLNLLSSPTGHLANLSTGAAEIHTVRFDFDTDTWGFVADFADYPPADADIYMLTSGHRRLPAPLDSESGLFISGVNRSDDLFMFFKAAVGGLVPGARYAVTAGAEIATEVPAGCFGVGGAPGESVWIKVGVSDEEPLPALEDDWLRMNIDVGVQSNSGENAQVLGNVANSRDCEQPPQWEHKSFPAQSISEPVTASPDGRVWLLVGVDSGFESRTQIFFTKAWARFARQ